MLLELNGKKVEIDFFEVGMFERYEKAGNYLETTPISKKNNIEIIKSCCDAIYTFFDILLGDGIANEIFASRYNLKICSDCLITCVKECNNYLINDFQKEMNNIVSNLEGLAK